MAGQSPYRSVCLMSLCFYFADLICFCCCCCYLGLCWSFLIISNIFIRAFCNIIICCGWMVAERPDEYTSEWILAYGQSLMDLQSNDKWPRCIDVELAARINSHNSYAYMFVHFCFNISQFDSMSFSFSVHSTAWNVLSD